MQPTLKTLVKLLMLGLNSQHIFDFYSPKGAFILKLFRNMTFL